jgi:hypothetical protein
VISIVQLGSFFFIPHRRLFGTFPHPHTNDALFSHQSALLFVNFTPLEISLLLLSSLFVLHSRQIKGITWRHTLLFLVSEIPSILFRPVKFRVFCSRLSPRGLQSPRLGREQQKERYIIVYFLSTVKLYLFYFLRQQDSVF